MAVTAVRVELPPASVKRARNKATITGAAGTVVLNITRPEVEWRGLADEWTEERTATGGLNTQRVGRRLRSFTLSALLTKERDENPSGQPDDVQAEIATLLRLAAPDVPDRSVAVSYVDTITPYMPRSGQGWIISEFTFRSVRRRPSDNNIVRAEVDLTFTEVNRPPAVARPDSRWSTASVGPTPAPPSMNSAPVPAQRRHTVAAGETLWSIATKHYGDGNLWPRIASANSIRDPRAIRVGQVLTIP
jgi:nucleoid-associated protein YgaU